MTPEDALDRSEPGDVGGEGTRPSCGSDIPAVFVARTHSLSSSPGGQQLCTREFLETIRTAGFCLATVSCETDNRLLPRLRRRFRPRPYSDQIDLRASDEVLATVRATRAEFVFLNLVDLAPLAAPLRRRLGAGCKLVLLSHGLESVDYLHLLKAQGRRRSIDGRHGWSMLGGQLLAEYHQRQAIDHVFCLTAFEAEMERWLGAGSVDWLPRTIPSRPLDWTPHSRRLGFVGTLDHPPTWEGLNLFAQALQRVASGGVRLRVVGGPVAAGFELGRRFGIIDYCGSLNDSELEDEARTWHCVAHPLFCYARGCSTKLAVVLGWHLPVVTTPAGCRGYLWREGNLPLANDAEALAALALSMLQLDTAEGVRREVSRIVRSSPTLDEIANRMRATLFEDPGIRGRTLIAARQDDSGSARGQDA